MLLIWCLQSRLCKILITWFLVHVRAFLFSCVCVCVCNRFSVYLSPFRIHHMHKEIERTSSLAPSPCLVFFPSPLRFFTFFPLSYCLTLLLHWVFPSQYVAVVNRIVCCNVLRRVLLLIIFLLFFVLFGLFADVFFHPPLFVFHNALLLCCCIVVVCLSLFPHLPFPALIACALLNVCCW